MANLPFEAVVINLLERPTSTDINLLQMQAHYDVRQFAYELFARQNGFLGYSFNPEATSPSSDDVSIQQGVAFQYGPVESNIGSISGLSDTYRQKAVNTSVRLVASQAAPTTASYQRYDLIQIRAPEDAERLVNQQPVGVFDPSLKSFSSEDKAKTLTSSLDTFTVEYVAAPAVGLQPLVYKSGVEGAYATWVATPKPAVDTGYLGVAYIKRYQGQTAIETADIEDARTLLVVPAQSGGTGVSSLPLPMAQGGTGRAPTSGDTMGSVAYLDTATDQIKYTQAATGLYDEVPVSGYLLSSNTAGAPTWIPPGNAGQVLTSTGTEWISSPRFTYESIDAPGISSVNGTDWTEFTGVSLSSVSLRYGPATIGVQPLGTGVGGRLYAGNATALAATVYFKVEITDADDVVYKVYQYAAYALPTADTDFPYLPLCVASFPAGTYTVKVYGKVPNSSMSAVLSNCSLFVSQG